MSACKHSYRLNPCKRSGKYIWLEQQEVSCVRRAGGWWGMASHCPVQHTGFPFSVSPTTVRDFPNCKSNPFMKPTNSGWQHSLHRHAPHFSRPTLFQLLTVCVFTMFSLPSVIPEQLPGKTNKSKTKLFCGKPSVRCCTGFSTPAGFWNECLCFKYTRGGFVLF